jgi:hypothetical protein
VRKRNKDYFDPKFCTVGAGPRRDLTAVEAAIVLERPIETVATMMLFGLIKKGKVKVESEEYPMKLAKLATEGDYEYENGYLQAIETDGTMNRPLLKKTMINLIDSVSTKLKGFDLEATKAYYERIYEKAWQQVKDAGTPEEFAKVLEDGNEWMMLDDDYERRMREIYVIPFIFHRHTTGTGSGTPTPVGGRESIASRYMSQLKSASNNLVSDARSLTKEITAKVNPPPVYSPTQGQRGGSFGGGCACACACAGGGR